MATPAQRYEIPGKAPVQQPSLLPEQLTNRQPQAQVMGRPTGRNTNRLGEFGQDAFNYGTAGATAGGTIGSAFGPAGTGVGTAIGAVAGAQMAAWKAVINSIRDWSAKKDAQKSYDKLEKYLGKDQNDPKVQAKVQKYQARLNKYNPGQLAPGQDKLPPEQQQAILQQGAQGQQGTPEFDFFGGRRAYNEQVPLFTPNQQAYQNETIQQLRQNPADFGAIRNEELRRFHEETAPQIANQYFGRNPSSFGSAYPEALGRGGALLGSKLAAAQSQFEAEREARRQNVALQPSYTTAYHPREKGFTENALNAFGSKAVEGIGTGFGEWIKGFGNKGTNQSTEDTQGTSPTTSTQRNMSPVNQQAYQSQQPAPLSNFPGPYSPSLVNDPAGIQKLLMQQSEAKNNKLGGRTR